MWTSLLQWAQQIVAMAVLFTLVSLLMPDGSLRGTVRAVMGLALLAAVVGPVVGVVEDAGVWNEAATRWVPVLEPREPVPGGMPLVREGLEASMNDRALELSAARSAQAVRRALEGAGYEVLEVAWRLDVASGPRLEVRVRRRARLGVEPDRLPDYVAALAGLEDARALELEVVP
ncbi:MAG TPA: stage III sporulation protein AF [Limnochordales bacterium]